MVKRLLAVILILLWGCSTPQRRVRTVPAMLLPPEQPLNRPTEAFPGSQARFPGQDKTFSPDGNPTPLTVNWSLEWDPSPGPDVIAYRVYYGPLPGSYTNGSIVVGGTSAVIPVNVLLPLFYAVTAISTNGLESDFSEEINFATLNGAGIAWELPTNQPTGISAQLSTNLVTWQTITSPFVFNQPNAFYRLRLY